MARPLPTDVVTADILSDRIVLAGPPSLIEQVVNMAAELRRCGHRVDVDPQVARVEDALGRVRSVWTRASGEVMSRAEIDRYLGALRPSPFFSIIRRLATALRALAIGGGR